MNDIEREWAIQIAFCKLRRASNHEERDLAWREMANLINARSKERVKQMELERGLTRDS